MSREWDRPGMVMGWSPVTNSSCSWKYNETSRFSLKLSDLVKRTISTWMEEDATSLKLNGVTVTQRNSDVICLTPNGMKIYVSQPTIEYANIIDRNRTLAQIVPKLSKMTKQKLKERHQNSTKESINKNHLIIHLVYHHPKIIKLQALHSFWGSNRCNLFLQAMAHALADALTPLLKQGALTY